MQFFQLSMDRCSREALFDFRSEVDILFIFSQYTHLYRNSYKLKRVFFVLEKWNLFLSAFEGKCPSNSKFYPTPIRWRCYSVAWDKNMNLSWSCTYWWNLVYAPIVESLVQLFFLREYLQWRNTFSLYSLSITFESR